MHRNVLKHSEINCRILTLSKHKPVYFQGEAIRMARQLPGRLTREDVKDIWGQVITTLSPGQRSCFHDKPFLLNVYNLDDIFSQTQGSVETGSQEYGLTKVENTEYGFTQVENMNKD